MKILFFHMSMINPCRISSTSHWIGLRENLPRKPLFLPSNMEVSGEHYRTNPMNLFITSHKTQKSPTPTSHPPKAPEGRWLDIPFAQSLAALLAAPAPNPPGKGPALASLGSRCVY